MSKYAVYQIPFDAMREAMGNDGWDSKHPLVRAYLRVTLGAEEYRPELFEFYEHVMNIEAEGLEDSFKISNIGPVENIESLSKHTSMSVGNIVIDPEGKKWFVDSFGFEEIS